MLRHRIALALAVVMILSCSVTAFAKEQTIKVDGLIMAFSEEPIVKDNQTLINIKDICKFLGASMEWDRKAKTITVTKGDTTMTITEGKKEYYLGDDMKYFPVTPVIKNDVLMVPLRTVCEAFGAKVGNEAKTGAITVNTGSKSLQVMNTTETKTEDTKVLTYKEALNKAIRANSSLKDLEESADYMEETRKDAIKSFYDAVNGITVDVATYGSVDVTQMSVTLMRTTNQLGNQMSMIPLREQITKETVEFMLRSALSSVASYEMDIQFLEESMKLQTRNINNLTLKQSLGMASANDVRDAKQSLEQSKSSMNLLKISLEKEKNSLKKLMDYNGSADIAVQYQPVIKPIDVNIKSYASARVSNDPSVKIKKILVDDAEYMLDTYIDEMEESELKLENDYKTAARDLYDTERNLESAIRAAYNDILSLEEKQKSLEIELKKAKDSYNDMVANYEAGLVTMYEVDALKLAVLQTEISMSKNAYSYWNMTYAFEKPFLLTAGQ